MPPGIAVSTANEDPHLHYTAIDPVDPDDEGAVSLSETDLTNARSPAPISGLGVRGFDAQALMARALTHNLGTLAHFGGNSEGASALLPSGLWQQERAERPRETRATPLGNFRGVGFSFSAPGGGTLSVFYGIDIEVDAALGSGDATEALSAQARLDEDPRRQGRTRHTAILHPSERQVEVLATSDDGAALMINLER